MKKQELYKENILISYGLLKYKDYFNALKMLKKELNTNK